MCCHSICICICPQIHKFHLRNTVIQYASQCLFIQSWALGAPGRTIYFNSSNNYVCIYPHSTKMEWKAVVQRANRSHIQRATSARNGGNGTLSSPLPGNGAPKRGGEERALDLPSSSAPEGGKQLGILAFLFLVAMPFAPGGILAPSSDARSP